MQKKLECNQFFIQDLLEIRVRILTEEKPAFRATTTIFLSKNGEKCPQMSFFCPQPKNIMFTDIEE